MFWTGELDEQQASDEFIGSTSPHSWHGGQLIGHLAARLHGNIGFTELLCTLSSGATVEVIPSILGTLAAFTTGASSQL